MRSSCDGCGTTSLQDVHYCVVCGASVREVGTALVPSPRLPPALITVRPPSAPLPVRRRQTPPTPKPSPPAPARQPRRFAGRLTFLLMAALVAGAGTGVLAGLWWLFSGDEPPAAEYVKLKDRHIHALAFSPDGTKLQVDTDDAGQGRWTWDLGARPWKDVDDSPAEAPEKGHVTAAAVSPDGTRFATGAESTKRKRKILIFTWDYVYTTGVVRVRKQDSGEIAWQSSVSEADPSSDKYLGEPDSLAFSPDGSLLVGDYSGGATVVWEAATGRIKAKLTGDVGGFSPDGKLLAVDSYRSVQLWDTATSKVKRTLAAPAGRDADGYAISFESLAFAPDGRVLAAGLSDGTVRLWDVATGAVTATMTGLTGSADALVFSPDGRLLAAQAGDGTVRLWDGGTGLERTLPRGGSALVFSPDGRWLAIGSGDGTVRLWDSASGQQARVWEHRERSVLWTTELAISHLAFSPDGTKLAVASNEEDDGRVALWELP